MKTKVTSRHGDVPDEIKERALTLIEKTARKAPRPQRAEIIFDTDHSQKIVELQLFIARRAPKVSVAEADDYRTALDRAIEKLSNQLDKTPTARDRRAASDR